jgi:uncharacterized oxidoreductase
MTETISYVTIHAEPLKDVVRAIVTAAGSSAREADLVADHLIEANLTGHDSHGVGMLPRYVEVFLAGDLKINEHVSVVSDTGPMLTLNGNAGFGQVMGFEAMERGIERAAQHGVAVVGLANSHHIGRIGHWAEQCIRAGYVSMHYVNVISEPVVAPFGGRDARFVTNPFCVGIPLPGQEPILLDFATSRIAMGKVRVAMNKALVCELLGGALAGGGTLHYKPKSRAIVNNMLSIIIDPDRMGTAANLSSETAEFVKWVKESPVAQGVDRIKIAGEPERDFRSQRGANGLPVDVTTWGEIIDAAAQLGMQRADVERLARIH